MKKSLAFLSLWVGLTLLVPSAYARVPFHHFPGHRGGFHGGHHGYGWGWFLPGLVIGGGIGWSFFPYYWGNDPVYPPAYGPPSSYYYSPPTPDYSYAPPSADYSPVPRPYMPPSRRSQPFSGSPAESTPGSDSKGASVRIPKWVPGYCTSYSPRPGVVVEECHEGRWE